MVIVGMDNVVTNSLFYKQGERVLAPLVGRITVGGGKLFVHNKPSIGKSLNPILGRLLVDVVVSALTY